LNIFHFFHNFDKIVKKMCRRPDFFHFFHNLKNSVNKIVKKMCRRPDFYEAKCDAGKTYETKCATGQIF